MAKQIILTWVRIFLGVIAVSYLVSLKYPEFTPKPVYTLVFSFVYAVVVGIIAKRRAKHN